MPLYLLVFTCLGCALTILDKHLAMRRRWRIPEPVLLLTAFLGGSLGVLLGMIFSMHKTKKPLFFIGIPVILGVQILLLRFMPINIY